MAGYRELKEAFVSGTNGTTAAEIDALLATPLLFVVIHGIFHSLVYAFLLKQSAWYGERLRQSILFGVEFLLLACPPIFVFTVAADSLAAAYGITSALAALLLLVIIRSRKGDVSVWSALSSRSHAVDLGRVFLTYYRAHIQLATAVCILAVDFTIFPRRFAKAETYGKGLMDIGVGCYIISSAVVSKEAQWPCVFSSEKSWLGSWKVVKSSLVLLALGAVRLQMTSATDYQTHVSEYGVHWNFFFTLAAVKVVSAAILSLFTPARAFMCFSAIAAAHQLLLSCCGLSAYVAQDGLRDGYGVAGLVAANREGLVSCVGYVTLHMAGISIGQHLFAAGGASGRNRPLIGWCRLLVNLSAVSGAAMLACLACERYVEQTSRQTANVAYILWMIHVNLLLMSTMLLASIILDLVSSCCASGKRAVEEGAYLLSSINYNGLFFFLFSNILTGLVNILVDTLRTPSLTALLLLVCYLFSVCCTVYVLYRKGIKCF